MKREKKSKVSFDTFELWEQAGVVTYYNYYGKLPKGTYYFQVKLKDASQPNAYYSMKWK